MKTIITIILIALLAGCASKKPSVKDVLNPTQSEIADLIQWDRENEK